MNVIYDKKKPIKVGSTLRWELRGMGFDVIVLGMVNCSLKV